MENQNNITNQDTGSRLIEEYWVKNQLPQLVKNLPYNELSEAEQFIIDKVSNGGKLDDDELSIIKTTCAEYDSILKKYNVEEMVESNETLNELLGTEKELLDFVYNKEPPIIKVQLPINGVNKVFNFTVKPLDDSRAVQFLQPHVDIFKDLSDEEKSIYYKNQEGGQLNTKEENVLKHINEKITQNQSRSQMENITELLASQIEEPKSLSFEEKKKFWGNFHFITRVQIYSRLMDKLGLTEEFNEKLFLD